MCPHTLPKYSAQKLTRSSRLQALSRAVTRLHALGLLLLTLALGDVIVDQEVDQTVDFD